jgi:hypothetical protein
MGLKGVRLWDLGQLAFRRAEPHRADPAAAAALTPHGNRAAEGQAADDGGNLHRRLPVSPRAVPHQVES